MLYLFYGSDTERVRGEAARAVTKWTDDHDGAGQVLFDAESWQRERFEECLWGQTLTGELYAVVCRSLSLHPDAAAFCKAHANDMQRAPHLIVLIEGALTKSDWGDVCAIADRAERYDRQKEVHKKDDPEKHLGFALSDAIGARDRKTAWIVYHRGLKEGLAPEQLFWKCAWQVKNMLLVSTSGSTNPVSAEALTMHPYVFGKMSRAARNYSTAQLVDLHRKLLVLYHDSRREKMGDLRLGLERLLLEL